MIMRYIFLLPILFVTLSSSVVHAGGAIEDILLAMVDAYGGKANLERFSSYTQEWELVSPLRGAGSERRFVAFPDRFRVELGYSDGTETRIVNGDAGYKLFGDKKVVTAGGPDFSAMRFQRMRLYSPLVLLAKKDALALSEDKGYKFIVLTEGPVTASYRVNPATFRIEAVTGQFAMHGQTMTFHTEYSDFRKTEGVLFPHQETKFSNGMKMAVLTLKKTERKQPESKLFDEP